MKKIFLCLLISFMGLGLNAQSDTSSLKEKTLYRIIKTDGGEIIGKIISEDEREIYVLTKDQRRIYIPQHAKKNSFLYR